MFLSFCLFWTDNRPLTHSILTYMLISVKVFAKIYAHPESALRTVFVLHLFAQHVPEHRLCRAVVVAVLGGGVSQVHDLPDRVAHGH